MSTEPDLRFKLLELKDPTHPLLIRLRAKAPGTYFHSFIVAELAASAAIPFKGKADPLLAQVGGLYHDIGKMSKPEAYAENQEDSEYPFQPEVILTHVKKGIDIAKAYDLPDAIQRFMATHHGTQTPPQNKKTQSQSYPLSFRPQTIEETLVMLADSSEAAVRSSQHSDRDGIKNIVRSVIDAKIHDDQLRDSVLISNDLDIVEEHFLEVFIALYHRRHATERKE